jgi:uncharacterized protein (TIGR01244 family)
MLVLALAAAVLATPASAPATVDVKEIPNYHLVRPGLATAGQPSEAALGRLKTLGFRTVVNLRQPGEQPESTEKETVTAQGLRYVSVPIDPATFGAAEVAAVRAILDDPTAAPVLLHCTSANRSAAVWGAVEVSRGRAVDEVEAEAREAGMTKPAIVDAFRRAARETAPASPRP